MLNVGEHAPWFKVRSSNNPNGFSFETMGGQYVVLCFFGSAHKPVCQKMLESILKFAPHFDDKKLCFFGVSCDPDDETLSRVKQRTPGIRYFWDFDKSVAHSFNVIRDKTYYPVTYILDPFLRVLKVIPLTNWEEHEKIFNEAILNLPDPELHTGSQGQAPVLITPRVFEPEFCKKLISLYNAHGGKDSGFMYEKDGMTVGKINHSHKKRKDYTVTDQDITNHIKKRILTNLLPSIKKAFQFDVDYIERYIVAHYSSEDKGFFFSHRDNTTKATAHRQFAVTINLNSEEFEGGELRFPEFGSRTYKAPTGGAVVFSCSLLHEALPVTKGERYAFLPFLYNSAAAKIKEENAKFLNKEDKKNEL